MATTVPGAFTEFRHRLEITSLQQSTVSLRQQGVRNAVARRLSVLDSFLTGSYRRHTMIAPLSQADVDIFVVLEPALYTATGYASILDRTRRALLETYTRSPHISRNGQAVTIRFSDFVVDVVPAFFRSGGGYLMPSTAESRWIATNPKVHETFLSRANASHSGDLVPLIKMLKVWNRNSGSFFRSFYLELLVEAILRDVTISDLPSGCRYIFDKGREAVRYAKHDPSGLGSQVFGLSAGVTVQQAVARFTAAFRHAGEAERLARELQVGRALGEWRKVFGDPFPTYG